MIRSIGCIILAFQCFISSAQQLLSNQPGEQLYSSAKDAYDHGAYKTASLLFGQYLEQASIEHNQIEANFYRAMSELKEGEKDGSKRLVEFTGLYRNHPLSSGANLELGHYAFQNQNYPEAILYYNRVTKDLIPQKELIKMLFHRGYAYMKSGDKKKAVEDFKQVSYYHKDYYQEAVYYCGLIYSNDGKYKEALEILKEADGSDDLPLIQELIANIYFQTKQYDELVKYAAPKLTDKPTPLNKTLQRLMGETYYIKKEYNGASKYMQRHLELSGNKMDPDGYFKLGHSYYKTQKDQQAIDAFKFAALDKGSLGQASSYYLGQLYIKQKKYSFALSAFQTVLATTDGDPNLIEESAFLVGKLNFNMQQYAAAITALHSFNDKYPNSKWSLESSELLTQSFLQTSDYEKALSYMESLPKQSPVIKEAYQKICFLKGQQLFNDSKFGEAITYFDRSLTSRVKPELTMQALYLSGDAKSILGDYEGAKQAYLNCRRVSTSTQWPVMSYYGLAYLAYNQQNYSEAASYFKSFLQVISSAHSYYADAKLRLADCFFVQKQYADAIATYRALLSDNRPNRDYLYYQMGLTYSLSGQMDESRKAFKYVAEFNGTSTYKDNAVYQIAETYITEAQFAKAIEPLNKLIGDYPESPLIPYAYNKRALCYLNLNQNEFALQDYTSILDGYISHQVANDALLGLQELSKRGVSTPDLDQYMSEFQKANPDNASLEVLTFEGSKTKYYNQDYNGAISSFTTFVKKYPESSYLVDAQYFLADSYYRSEDWSNAAASFKVLSESNNPYRSRALDKRGKSLLEQANYKDALLNYTQFLNIASNRKEEYTAREGLMKTHFLLNDMDSVLFYASKILKADWIPVGVEESIWLTQGKAFYFKGKYPEALDEFIKVVNGPVDASSAEAKYYVAKTLYLQQQYQRSLETLFELNKIYGSYSEWIGKSFLLIAENYIATKELLQAKATLNSIIENAQDTRLITEAKKKLAQIEASENQVILKDSLSNEND